MDVKTTYLGLSVLAISLLFGFACGQDNPTMHNNATTLPAEAKDSLIATSFDYPVGPPNAKGYYNAQGFGKNTHLGDDWNGNGGGNTDLGDTVYAIANGFVTEAADMGAGWGNVLRIAHYLPKGHAYAPAVESLYAHLDEMFAQPGVWIAKGTPIGTIGNANGAYYAHLHLELRERPGLPLGGGYSTDATGYINPTWFIKKNR